MVKSIKMFTQNEHTLQMVIPLSSRQMKKAMLPARIDIQSVRVV